MRIAFLGGGNMAGALIGGLIAKGFDATAIHVVEVSPDARERLAKLMKEKGYDVFARLEQDIVFKRRDVKRGKLHPCIGVKHS